MIDKLEKQQEQLADAAAKFEEATGSIPDHNLPVANQLEMAITKIKEHVRIIVGTREENKALKKVCCRLGKVVCKLGLETMTTSEILTESDSKLIDHACQNVFVTGFGE